MGLALADIILLIGTNHPASTTDLSTAEQVTSGLEAVVSELHTALPQARILLIEILPSGVSPEKSAKDAAVNAALRSAYGQAGFVRCLDLRSLYVRDGALDAGLFYDPQLVPPRSPLHPNTQGQQLVAAAVAKALDGGSPAP